MRELVLEESDALRLLERLSAHRPIPVEKWIGSSET
jgi:hypothetical protein